MIGDSLNTWNSTISDHKFYCRISQEFYLYVSCFALFPFFMLQIRLSCVILPKKGIFTFNIKCKLLSVVSFSQRVTVRQIFYTRSNPLVDLHFHQVSNCGSLYVRQMCKLERYEAPSLTYSLYVTKKVQFLRLSLSVRTAHQVH